MLFPGNELTSERGHQQSRRVAGLEFMMEVDMSRFNDGRIQEGGRMLTLRVLAQGVHLPMIMLQTGKGVVLDISANYDSELTCYI